jgi:hypothetical protein
MIVDLRVCYLQLQWDESRTGRQAKPLKSRPGAHRPDPFRAPCRHLLMVPSAPLRYAGGALLNFSFVLWLE